MGAGIKCLVLDEETASIMSLVYTQSQILKKDIYLIEKIENPSEQKMLHLKAVYFIRPTEFNFNCFKKEMSQERFSEYYLFFSNVIPNYQIEKLAEIDEHDLIKSVQEVYADYYVVNSDFFSLQIPSTFGLIKDETNWNKSDTLILKRTYEGLLAILYSLRKIPQIRYLANSLACRNVAEKLSQRIRQDYDQNMSQFDRDSRTLLLITDRREDPITPLLNQWTYQAMLHELIGLHNNRIDLEKGLKALDNPDNKKNIEQDQKQQFVISGFQDQFFDNNMYSNFGELAQNIKDFIEQVSSLRQNAQKIESLEDMQKAIEKIPELRQMSGNLDKHVTLTCKLSKLVEERNLMNVSKLEQEIACNDARNDHAKAVFEQLNDPNIKTYEKLKLVIIYALRYEDSDKIAKMKEKLRDFGLEQNSLNLINYAVDYAGKKQRLGDLFGSKDLFERCKRIYKQTLKTVDNVFTQHQPYLLDLLEQIKSNKLKQQEYSTINLNNLNGPPQEIIIFMLGGVTYEEATTIGLQNKQGANILLGGTYIHNSRTFLAEISRMKFEKSEVAINMDEQRSQKEENFNYLKYQ